MACIDGDCVDPNEFRFLGTFCPLCLGKSQSLGTRSGRRRVRCLDIVSELFANHAGGGVRHCGGGGEESSHPSVGSCDYGSVIAMVSFGPHAQYHAGGGVAGNSGLGFYQVKEWNDAENRHSRGGVFGNGRLDEICDSDPKRGGHFSGFHAAGCRRSRAAGRRFGNKA